MLLDYQLRELAAQTWQEFCRRLMAQHELRRQAWDARFKLFFEDLLNHPLTRPWQESLDEFLDATYEEIGLRPTAASRNEIVAFIETMVNDPRVMASGPNRDEDVDTRMSRRAQVELQNLPMEPVSDSDASKASNSRDTVDSSVGDDTLPGDDDLSRRFQFQLAALQNAPQAQSPQQPAQPRQLMPITIYIDVSVPTAKGRPSGLTAQSLPLIQNEVNKALTTAGLAGTVKLIGTKLPPGTSVGFQTAGLLRRVTAYNHEFQFKVGQGGGRGVFMSRPGITDAVGNYVDLRHPGATPQQWANIILHEVFYLGVLGKSDFDDDLPIAKPTAGRSLYILVEGDIDKQLLKKLGK